MERGIFRGAFNRVLQLMAQLGPGGKRLRAQIHRWRGVRIGKGVWVGYDTVIETAHPQLVSIGDYSEVGLRSTIVAHFRDEIEVNENGFSVQIGKDVFIGAGVTILPGVSIGDGAVVAAGSVVTQSVPPMTLVQGNPAEAVARCGMPLTRQTTLKEFTRSLLPL